MSPQCQWARPCKYFKWPNFFILQKSSKDVPMWILFLQVCGTDNKTYATSCELFATKCNLEGTKEGHRLHLDYTGSCKRAYSKHGVNECRQQFLICNVLPPTVIPQCQETELVQFPLRMRDWLKNVLLQLYVHDTNSPGFLTPKQHFRVILSISYSMQS